MEMGALGNIHGLLEKETNMHREPILDDNTHCHFEEEYEGPHDVSAKESYPTVADPNDEVGVWVDDGDESEEERLSLRLVGKLWSNRILNPIAFVSTIKNVWVTR